VAIQLASLQGRLFFDYNGNGVQDGDEPAVAGALVLLKDDAGSIVAQALSDSSGDYKLQDVRAGAYKLHVGVDHFSDRRFTHMCTSPNEHRAVSDDYHVSIQETTSVDIGLMEGFLTLPFRSDLKPRIARYYDWDPSRETYLWWNHKHGSERSQGGTINHPGTDYDLPTGTPLLSAAPGTISHVGLSDDVNYVYVYHGNNFTTAYDHVSKVLVRKDQMVRRGEMIAESGESGTDIGPHLHFDLRFPDHRILIDPYSPVFDLAPTMRGYLSIIATAQTTWVPDPNRAIPNGLGYWTKKNDPQFPPTQSS
jgi:hypothetical protein